MNVIQSGIPGIASDTVAGDKSARVAYLLEKHPDARDNYRALMFWYWLEFDGLEDVLPPNTLERFRRWLTRQATSPKTIQNRAGEVQNDIPQLEATRSVAELRQRQARQGRVR